MIDILSGDSLRRYSRNLMLDGVGAEGQRKLLDASVAVVGCGALGTVVALYLAGSGVGNITLIDFDTIDISNLQRQIAYDNNVAGEKKAEVLARKLEYLNPDVKVSIKDILFGRKNGEEIVASHEVIVEGSDNPETKYVVNDLCVKHGKPFVLGGVFGYKGQVLTHRPGTATYRDIFPVPAPKEGCTPCSEGGVLGPLPGIIGSIQAAEVIKLITGTGELLTDRLLSVDAMNMHFDILRC